MQINIEVDETQFKDIVNKTLADLPKETLQEIVLEGIKKYLTESGAVRDLLVTKASYYSSSADVIPSQFLKELMSKTTPTDKINDIRDEMLGVLRNNYDSVLRKSLAEILANGLFTSGSFRNSVMQIFLEQQACERSKS